MEVILREDVQELGQTGEVVNVSPGYARNYPYRKTSPFRRRGETSSSSSTRNG